MSLMMQDYSCQAECHYNGNTTHGKQQNDEQAASAARQCQHMHWRHDCSLLASTDITRVTRTLRYVTLDNNNNNDDDDQVFSTE